MSEVEVKKLVVQLLPSLSGRTYVLPVYARVASGAFKAFRDERGVVPGPPFHFAFPEIRSSASGEQQPASHFGFVGYIEVATVCTLPAGAFGGTTAMPTVTIFCKPKSATFCREDSLGVRATASSVPTVPIGDSHLPMRAIRDLYQDLLTQHRDRRTAVENDAGFTGAQKMEEDERLEELMRKTSKSLSAYGNRKNKDVTDLILQHLTADEHEVDPFDENRLLFAFTNKVYNLKTHTFAPHFKFDYVLTNCGREWHEPTAAQLDKVRAVIESIMPDAGERKMLISVLRNGLSGVRPELFIILTGEGRNGKSLLVEWIQFLLGAYGMEGKITTLTEKPKSGAETELANQHKKPLVVYSEPEEAALEALRLSNIKLLTGNETVNARGLFDARDKTQMHSVPVLECNKLPVILGDKGESARERLGVQHFPFTFTNDAAKLASGERAKDDELGITLDENKYKPKDESLKSRTFKEEHYCAFFQYLVDTDRVDTEDGVGIHITEKAKQRAGKYLDANNLMPTWVSEHYDDADASENAFIAIKDIFCEFKASEHYQNLSQRERTLMNEKKFRSAISKSAKYKPQYREKGKVRLGDGKYNTKDGLVDLKNKSEDGPGSA